MKKAAKMFLLEFVLETKMLEIVTARDARARLLSLRAKQESGGTYYLVKCFSGPFA